MKQRLKTVLSAFAPMIISCVIIIGWTLHQTNSLIGGGGEINKVVFSGYMTQKKEELIEKTKIIKNIIDDFYQSTDYDAKATKEKTKDFLLKLDFSKTRDDYFFSYLYDGQNFVHPAMPERMERYELERQDAEGKFHIKEMIDVAKTKGEGFVTYTVLQPSKNSPTPKLSYVIALPDLGIIVGTGIYLNDIDDTLAHLNHEVSQIIYSTIVGMVIIVLICILTVGFIEWRTGQAIGRQIGQQKGRDQISDNLHDWISQNLIFVKRKLDVALKHPEETPDSLFRQGILRQAKDEINKTLLELNLIIDNKDPLSISLAMSLKEYASRSCINSGIPIDLEIQDDICDLSDEAKIALYSVTRLALDNSAKHAGASRINLQLLSDYRYVTLIISDNGIGFDIEQINRGRGLRNMKRYIEREKGSFSVNTSDLGTKVEAKVPCRN